MTVPLWGLIFISGLCSFTLCISPQYHHVSIQMNYTDAKTYCRKMYTDLATLSNIDDVESLIGSVPVDLSRAWIGLEEGDVWQWHWTYGEGDFFNWRDGQLSQNNCVAMGPSGQWFEDDCERPNSYVCSNGGQINAGLIFVDGKMSWRDAQSYCRNINMDLVSIQSLEENQLVLNVTQNQTTWIGLFKDPWTWSDGSSSSLRFWKPFQPTYNNKQACVVAVFVEKGRWNDRRCDISLDFICQGALKARPLPSTPQPIFSSAQPTTQPNTPSTETTVVVQTNTTTPSTSTNAITGKSPTQNTLMASPAQNMTSKSHSRAVTTTQQVTNSNPTAPATSIGGEASQSIAQSSAAMTTENSHGLTQDNLILVRKNMTWMQAQGYCRQHHINLVSVTTQVVQSWAAEKASNATTPYVWLGLRFTCAFSFWFWVPSNTGCYQNWAPGHGTGGPQDCSLAGAIETTGEQQWVSLPETATLNFLCYKCSGT